MPQPLQPALAHASSQIACLAAAERSGPPVLQVSRDPGALSGSHALSQCQGSKCRHASTLLTWTTREQMDALLAAWALQGEACFWVKRHQIGILMPPSQRGLLPIALCPP